MGVDVVDGLVQGIDHADGEDQGQILGIPSASLAVARLSESAYARLSPRRSTPAAANAPHTSAAAGQPTSRWKRIFSTALHTAPPEVAGLGLTQMRTTWSASPVGGIDIDVADAFVMLEHGMVDCSTTPGSGSYRRGMTKSMQRSSLSNGPTKARSVDWTNCTAAGSDAGALQGAGDELADGGVGMERLFAAAEDDGIGALEAQGAASLVNVGRLS